MDKNKDYESKYHKYKQKYNELKTLKPLTKLWYKCPKDNYSNLMFIDALTRDNYKRTYDTNWDIYLYCNGKLSNNDFKNVQISNSNQKIAFIYNNYEIGGKKKLWNNVKEYYGRDIAETILPPTYIFPEDKDLFESRYVKGNYYVLKNKKQRQKGIVLTSDINEILNYKENKFNIIQEFIGSSLLFKGHKMNFRIYLVIIINNSKVSAYMYNDGIVSYAKKYDKEITFNNSIASFYKSQKLYDADYPIILSQLKKELDLPWTNLMDKIKHKLKLIVESASSKFLEFDKKVTSFQLFGADVMFNEKLDPFILEINLGPGMKPHNEHDEKMRSDLMDNVVQLVNSPNHTSLQMVDLMSH